MKRQFWRAQAKVYRRIAKAEEFLTLLYGQGGQVPGFLTLWTKQDRATYWFPAHALADAARTAVKFARKYDVYFGVGLRAERMERGRGTRETVVAIPGLWVDLDVQGPGHEGQDLPPTPEDALQVVESFPLPPTILVSTGGGLHVYWLFHKPWIFHSAEERERAQDLIRRFQTKLQAEARQRGWRLDNTSDLARVLRLPSTFNHKCDPPNVVWLLQGSGRRYDPAEFEPHLEMEREPAVVVRERLWQKALREGLDEGHRNNGLTSLVGWLFASGMTEEQVLSIAVAVNQTHCRPPLPDREVEAIVRSIGRREAARREAAGERTTPGGVGAPALPLDVLPPELEAWARDVAAAMAVPTDYVLAAILGTAAGALGGTFRLEVEPGWVEAPRLWIALVGSPGSGKSPVLERVVGPLWDAHAEAMGKYEEQRRQYEQAMAERTKRGQGEADPPLPPQRQPLIVTDTTREALVDVLRDYPQGVLVVADELAGLIRDWTRYRDDGGRQAWLSLWSGAPLHVERKTAGYAFVKEPFVALVGGIQPSVVREVAPVDMADDGLLSRFLFAYPDPAPIPDVLSTPPDNAVWAQMVERLQMARKRGGIVWLQLAPEARALFNRERLRTMRLAQEAGDDHRAATLSKLPAQAARIALVLTALEAAELGRPVDRITKVPAASVERSWRLGWAFAGHAERVIQSARLRPIDRKGGRVWNWIRERGGEARVRDIYTNQVAGIRTKAEAENVLRVLVEWGAGEFIDGGRGFRLTPDS
ncbi:MAG TPA: DUF3987 domain-containing protein [Thermaerobacter sp.]